MRGKIFLYIVLLIIIVIAIFLGVKSFFKVKPDEIKEYTPQEEISEEQERQTLVTLYFQNKETKDIMPEARLIDVKQLINNPCETLMKLLLEGPKNEKLESAIPKDVTLIGVTTKGNMAEVNLSTSITNIGKDEKERIMNSVKNTLVELAEIESVKILINGKELSI